MEAIQLQKKKKLMWRKIEKEHDMTTKLLLNLRCAVKEKKK